MPAYALFEAPTRQDPDALDQYRAAVRPIVKRFGGRDVVAGGAWETLDGDGTRRFSVVIEFPDLATARAWYYSDEYRPLRDLGNRVGTLSAMVIDYPEARPLVLRAPGLSIDVPARLVERDGQPITLTTREFDLLTFLMTHEGQAFSRRELLARVWGYTYGGTATVTVHIRRLREKLEANPSQPALLSTVRGTGYRFDGARAPRSPHSHDTESS